MGQEDLRILLEYGRDRDQGNVVGHGIEGLQGVCAHEEVELARDQEHAVIVVRTARHDGDVEPIAFVGAVGQCLEEAAVLRLRDPVGSERDLVQRLGAAGRNRHQQDDQAGR